MFATLFCLSTNAAAECVRWKPTPRPPNAAPEFDGPGSFGALHETVTLDCLRYVGSIRKGGVELVLIRDDRGTVHQLRLGSYIGENSGVITKIDRDAITITQLVKRGGRIEERIVRFARQGAAK